MELYSLGELAAFFGVSEDEIERTLEHAHVPVIAFGDSKWVRELALRALFTAGTGQVPTLVPAMDDSGEFTLTSDGKLEPVLANGNGNGHANGNGNGRATAGRRSTSRNYPDHWPPPDDVREHILAVLAEHDGRLSVREVYTELATRFQLAASDLDLRTPDGADSLWHAYVRWCRIPLVQEGVVESKKRGTWALVTAVASVLVVVLQLAILFSLWA